MRLATYDCLSRFSATNPNLPNNDVMLTILTGTDGRAKKEYISRAISDRLDRGERVCLVVPEQSSFDRDREFLFRYGERKSNRLTVTSFTRLCADLLESEGLRVRPQADEAARSVLMSLAVEDVSDSLEIYARHSGRSALVAELLLAYAEIRQAGLGPDALRRVSAVLPEGSLRRKTDELGRIFAAYEARIAGRFSEQEDNIVVAAEYLEDHPLYDGAALYFDDFRGFTVVQLRLMEQLFAQAGEVFVSVTVPAVCGPDEPAFSHACRTARSLRAAANRKSVPCRTADTDGEAEPSPLTTLRDSLFSFEPEIYEEETDRVTVARATDKYEECELAALEIRRLIAEEGYRCREIAVYERGSSYAPAMTAALKKYNIPVFTDKRVPLGDYPLVRAVLAAVRIAVFGFASEDVFALLKTEIVGVSAEDLALLENYVYLWQKDGGAWTKDFTDNPDGFGEKQTEETAAALERINAVRARVVGPLMKLRRNLSEADGDAACKAVFCYLTDVKAAEHFCDYAEYLNANGGEAEAVRCAAVWEQVMQSLDALRGALGDRPVRPRRFFELLKIILSSGDVGRIPAGTDEIVIGTAGRTRFTGPRAVFILGANEGVFPAPSEAGGAFSAGERRALCENDFALENLPENVYAEERGIAYHTLTCASERVWLSYAESGLDGAALQPSELIEEVKKLFPRCRGLSADDLAPEDRVGSPDAAFEEYARRRNEPDVFTASLRSYLESRPEESGRLSALRRAADKTPASFEDPALAQKLFGKDMFLSASRVEAYHKCPFLYFCRYGLGVEKRRPAGLDARIAGLLIHYVLEQILLKYKNSELTEKSPAELREETDALTESYITEFMGGREGMTRSLNRSLDRVKDDIFEILSRLVKEFGECQFETRDVELEIGKDGEIAPYRIALPDGGSITISGFVDRVDVMDCEGRAYLRVIDYKTGGKNFKLSDIFDGLNMQMLIYLMCLWDNGGERYGNVTPAGVLYVPAKTGGEKLPRGAAPEEVEAMKLKNGRMNGLLLESETVLRGMESAAAGKYLNASIDKNGRLKGTFLSLNEFRRLHEKIDAVLADTATSLHRGEIAALPVIDGDYKHTCEYCDYRDVCLREDEDPFRKLLGLSHADAAALLNGEVRDDG